MSTPHDFYPIVVPALDALIGNPLLISPEATDTLRADDLYIPAQYINQVRDFRNEQSSRGDASNKLLNDFGKISGKIHESNNGGYYTCKNGMRIHFIPDNKLDLSVFSRNGSTTHAVATALYLRNISASEDIAILTGDSYTATKAYTNDVNVAKVNPKVYLGRRKLTLPEDLHYPWLKNGRLDAAQLVEAFPDEPPLLINEFVEFELDPLAAEVCGAHNLRDYTKTIGRFEPIDESGTEGELRALHHIYDLPRMISPRTAGQAMFLEAMLAPIEEIPLVICPATFGTGKTYLATAVGLNFVSGKEPQFDKIFVVPRDAELGDEIGFLPGDERAKTIAKAMPIVDAVRSYIKQRGDRKKGGEEMSIRDIDAKVEDMLDRYIDFVPIINMGGRSIEDNWIIYDEAQDMERFQIDQLMKRIGEGSKMIVIGDPHQVYHRHMNYHSNGLMYAASRLAGNPYACVVTMNESEITRSKAAREIAKCFSG